MTDRKLRIKQRSGYFCGMFGCNAAYSMVNTFLLMFYTDAMKLDAAQLSLMFLITKLVDGVTDYLVGCLIDRTDTKLGRNKPWMLYGIPVFVIGFLLVFAAPDFAASWRLAYAYLSYSIFCFGNPVVWFGGLAGLIVCAARALICKGKRRILSADSPRLVEKPYNESYIFLFVGFAAQFLPWVLVPRGTYIYHYFASIPFIILALVLAIHDWKGISRPVLFGVVSGISLLALISFIIFLPYACGLVAPVGWLDLGKGILRIWY